MEVGEAIKTLEKNGFKQLNWKGSHIKYGRETDRITIVCHRSFKERLHPRTVKQVNKFISN